MRRRIWLSPEQKDFVVEAFTKGWSPPSIARELGVCANNVRDVLRRRGHKMRDRSSARRRLLHRQDAFDQINPESAYWIGIFFADGTIYRGKVGAPVLAIGLAKRDREHLEKLRSFLGSEHAITKHRSTIRGRTHDGVRFTVRSVGLARALMVNGMTNKSLERIASPALLTSRDFWRGVVDGDGYVGVSHGKARLGLCGGKALVEQFLTFMRAHGVGHRSEIRRQAPIYRVDFMSETARRGVDLLYSNAVVCLERKGRRATAAMKKKGRAADKEQHGPS